MLVGVCDFPGDYAFPPSGYGGIERWLWAVAEGARAAGARAAGARAAGARAAGADVHLLGPLWRDDLAPEWTRRPVRLEDLEPGSRAARELRATGYDLLIVGHEYPTLPASHRTRELLDCDVATFQHHPGFQHAADSFDGVRDRLYCYSPEMLERYAVHRPIAEQAVHLGLNETEPPSAPGRDLVWVGRIDEDKAPHLAVRAAQILGRRIRLVGPVFDESYVRNHAALLTAEHVEWVGEVGGAAKTAAFRDASVFVYTYARTYVEAGAAVFGESLRAGTPIPASPGAKARVPRLPCATAPAPSPSPTPKKTTRAPPTPWQRPSAAPNPSTTPTSSR
ncbi:glycosyltransferase [Streptomyces sp. NPDC048436]|uniref:glycosyltransferase n=1 Tax=Streptomyces sp. NPDC048436 TaxID=3365550 RepID=UPI0037159BBB